MDWQVIILTLGASIITGAVSLLGSIISSRVNFKKLIFEKENENKREYMRNRLDIYGYILYKLNEIVEDISDNDEEYDLTDSEIESKWLESFNYCSKEINRMMYWFVSHFDVKNKKSLMNNIDSIRRQVKKETDEYYGIKEKDPF